MPQFRWPARRPCPTARGRRSIALCAPAPSGTALHHCPVVHIQKPGATALFLPTLRVAALQSIHGRFSQTNARGPDLPQH